MCQISTDYTQATQNIRVVDLDLRLPASRLMNSDAMYRPRQPSGILVSLPITGISR